MDLYDLKYEQLQEFVFSGRISTEMPADMVEYLNLLEIARGMYSRHSSKQAIIKTLISPVYGLSEYQAGRIFTHAMNFFYSNNEIKKDAWRSILSEFLMNDLRLAWEMNDTETYRRIIMSIAELKQLNIPDQIELPRSVYDKRPNVYVLDHNFFGLPDDTRELAAMIDALDVPEKQKIKAKRDARLIEDVEFKIFDDEEEEYPKD